VTVDGVEDLARDAVGFEHTAKFQPSRRIQRGLVSGPMKRLCHRKVGEIELRPMAEV
jgi:hypothetical protein